MLRWCDPAALLMQTYTKVDRRTDTKTDKGGQEQEGRQAVVQIRRERQTGGWSAEADVCMGGWR